MDILYALTERDLYHLRTTVPVELSSNRKHSPAASAPKSAARALPGSRRFRRRRHPARRHWICRGATATPIDIQFVTNRRGTISVPRVYRVGAPCQRESSHGRPQMSQNNSQVSARLSLYDPP